MVIKICGVRTKEIVYSCVTAGVEYIGLNFISSSKRYINPDTAKHLRKLIPSSISVVGVFADMSASAMLSIASSVSVTTIQLHGDESPEIVSLLQEHYPVIKSFRISPFHSAEEILGHFKKYSGCTFLIDREQQGKGEVIPFPIAKVLAARVPLFFAGGVTPENVARIIATVHPYGIDVASGVETNDAHSAQKIKALVREVRGVRV